MAGSLRKSAFRPLSLPGGDAEHGGMFAVHCPRHGRQVLLGISDLRSLDPAPDGGFSIGYRCTCGYEGLWPPASSEELWDSRMAG
jgi:hypothetical protein